MKKFMVVYIKILIEFFLHSNPCSNRPVLCEIFIVSYRTCNIQIHYETAHLDMLFLIYISEGEKIAVLKIFCPILYYFFKDFFKYYYDSST